MSGFIITAEKITPMQWTDMLYNYRLNINDNAIFVTKMPHFLRGKSQCYLTKCMIMI
jgi:hypothetical protein